MLYLVALHTLAVQRASQGLERNWALNKKGSEVVGSIYQPLHIQVLN